jgi:predicted anti-sigma-YlaC factor YlaD
MIRCRQYRRIIARSVDANAALPGPAQEHVRNCPACREHYESEIKVARQLSADAEAQRVSPSPFLHARIMASVAGSRRETAQRPMPWRLGGFVGLATACVVVAISFWLAHQPPPKGTVHVAAASGSAATQFSFTGQLPDQARLREWTAKLDEPLETEMKLVVSDARTAMNSLAANFLPGEVRSALFEPAPN